MEDAETVKNQEDKAESEGVELEFVLGSPFKPVSECEELSVGDIPQEVLEQLFVPTASQSEPVDPPKSLERRNGVASFNKKSVALAASAMGIEDLDESVCEDIAHESYYKTKEILYMAKLILNLNKRETLTTNDVQKAIQLHGGADIVEPDSDDEESTFIQLEHQGTKFYAEEDPEIDLMASAFAEDSYYGCEEPYIQGTWILAEDFEKKEVVEEEKKEISPYYPQFAKILMSNSPKLIRIALDDLRGNPKIGPICPKFLNLAAQIVDSKIPKSPCLINTVLGTIHSIALNKFAEPSLYLCVNRAANALVRIVLDEDLVSIDDYSSYLSIRVRAGLILAKIMTVWNIEIKQQTEIIKQLFNTLALPSLETQYAAVLTVTAINVVKESFLSLMDMYVPTLENSMLKDNTPEPMYKYLMAATLVPLRTLVNDTISLELMQKVQEFHDILYEAFGDSITPLRMTCNPVDSIYPVVIKTKRPYRLRLMPKKQSGYLICHVKRNIKYYQPSHTSSPVGDLFIIM